MDARRLAGSQRKRRDGSPVGASMTTLDQGANMPPRLQSWFAETRTTVRAAALTGALVLCLPAPALGGEPLQLLAFDTRAVPTALRPPGTLQHGLRWRDRNGENLVIFSRVETPRPRASARLTVRHWLLGARPRLLREVKDLVGGCEFDLTAKFLPASFGVTDLDGDGLGEVTFAYEQTCRSDVSPAALKLLVLENGDKYILRGETSVKVSDRERVGGGYTVDPSFRRAPKTFLPHAATVWARVVREDFE
jgi:hypothetical protein